MNRNTLSLTRGGRVTVVVLAVAAMLGGCVTYSQNQLSSMSIVDLCELQNMQGPNLSPETKQAMQSELQRRNGNCRNHAIELAQRYDAFMWHEMYSKHDDP